MTVCFTNLPIAFDEEAYGSILDELPEEVSELVGETDESADAGSYQRPAEGD